MKNKNGFTLMEIVTVVTIIIILMSIGIPAYNSWRNRAQIAKAKATISQIEMALEMYKTGNGVYPQQSSNLNTSGILKSCLAQYMKFDSNELDASNNLLDSWGNPYVVYVDNDGDPTTPPMTDVYDDEDPLNLLIPGVPDFLHNRNTCYIYSWGPDGSSSGIADNVDNYLP